MLNEFNLSNKDIEINKEISAKIDDDFKNKYPRYLNCKKEFESINQKYLTLEKKLIDQQNWQKKFFGYKKVIERHFKSISRPLIRAQQG